MIAGNHIEVSDGTHIAYNSHGPEDAAICIVLIHGFSGSSKYFVKNFATLSQHHRVIAYDLRGHGESSRSTHGYHVSRLSADLKALLDHLKSQNHNYKFVGVGCSIGSALLWSYAELFGSEAFYKFVFVDQAPLQNYAPDWTTGNYGCNDAASLHKLQTHLTRDPVTWARSLVEGSLGYRHAPDTGLPKRSAIESKADEEFFMNITLQCDAQWLALLMADHTQYDHRDTLKQCITIPSLICAGRTSGCFPLEGVLYTARAINTKHPGLAKTEIFDSGHWLYYEEPEHFNTVLLDFIAQ